MSGRPKDSTEMRIFQLSASFSPVLGGLQTVTYILAQNLLAQGHVVQVVTNRYPRSLPHQELLDSVSVKRLLFLWPEWSYLQRRRLDLFLASCFYGPVTFFRLWNLLRRFRPEVVNLHFPDSQIPFLIGMRHFFRFQLVVSLHGDDLLRWSTGRGHKSGDEQGLQKLRTILQRADAVTTCSAWLLEKAVELEPSIAGKGYVIHNGVDLKRFQDRTSYRHHRPYILAYGRLTYDKGFDLLLEAFAQVLIGSPNVDIVIAGSGEQKILLATRALELGIDNHVHFYGQAAPEEIVRLLNGSLFVVVPSRRETFGIVALEALAAGKPVLATQVGGLPEVLGSGEAVKLVEPTVEGLAEGLRSWLLSLDELQQKGERNRERAAHFTWERMTETYLNLFRGVD